MKKVSEQIYLFEDTCNVYVIKDDDKALLIDFGSGEVIHHLQEIGVTQVTDIFMTHHHRDQAQGLKNVQDSVRIWVPDMEYDLFQNVNEHWQAREVYNNYNVRQDRFSILQSIQVFGKLKDYSQHTFGPFQLEIVPTPGHTVGSLTVMIEGFGEKVACTGDLISHPGKVWSLSATQWTYNGSQGISASLLSLHDLKHRSPNLLLPSHGVPMDEPEVAIDLLMEKLLDLVKFRYPTSQPEKLFEDPYERVSEHVLWNKASHANSYVLLSESGKALIIDYGYDFHVGDAAGFDRAARRPWLYSIRFLKEKYGVKQIDVIMPTHFHDDHIAGINLLKEVEGAKVWAASNFSNILEQPNNYNLPCLWYDPISVDRVLPLDETVSWEEYEFKLYDQPGHALNAVAISFCADDKHFLAIGDQQENDGNLWNYVYQNKFQIDDYIKSGKLYVSLQPDVILSGHWPPLHIEPGYLESLRENGERLEAFHRSLLPLEEYNLGAEGFCAWINPYQQFARPGEEITVQVEVLNPFKTEKLVSVHLVVPDEWKQATREISAPLSPLTKKQFTFTVDIPLKQKGRRERIAADITIGNEKFGQQAEALITIL